MERLALRPLKPKHIGNLKFKSQGGLSNLAYSYNQENIPVELTYTASLHRHIQWENNPIIHKRMIPMAQSKIYWRLNVQSQGRFRKTSYSYNKINVIPVIFVNIADSSYVMQ